MKTKTNKIKAPEFVTRASIPFQFRWAGWVRVPDGLDPQLCKREPKVIVSHHRRNITFNKGGDTVVCHLSTVGPMYQHICSEGSITHHTTHTFIFEMMKDGEEGRPS